jgi:TatD DNase family protein
METQPLLFTDFHAHLDGPLFEPNRFPLIDQCVREGIDHIVTVADPNETGSLQTTAEVLRYSSHILAVVGAHPHQADFYSAEIETRILKFLENKTAIGIGEVGLDFHYQFADRQNQITVFQRQIAIAKEAGLPLVIHSREAEIEILEILNREKCSVPVIFHCYTGGIREAEEMTNRGFFISISGIVTFKNAEQLREVVRRLPLANLFTETDSPYLTPEPFRGKPNSPLLVRKVAEKIAEIKNIPLLELTQAVGQNLRSLVRKGVGQFSRSPF